MTEIRTSEQINDIAAALPAFREDAYWTSLLGYSRYLISPEGRVISVLRRTPRLMRPMRVGKYLAITMKADDGTVRREYVHRLVLEAMAEPPELRQEARHLNGNPHDNRLANLAWGSRIENAADRVTPTATSTANIAMSASISFTSASAS
jgi:hypothetical protein